MGPILLTRPNTNDRNVHEKQNELFVEMYLIMMTAKFNIVQAPVSYCNKKVAFMRWEIWKYFLFMNHSFKLYCLRVISFQWEVGWFNFALSIKPTHLNKHWKYGENSQGPISHFELCYEVTKRKLEMMIAREMWNSTLMA